MALSPLCVLRQVTATLHLAPQDEDNTTINTAAGQTDARGPPTACLTGVPPEFPGRQVQSALHPGRDSACPEHMGTPVQLGLGLGSLRVRA